jgi:hypothetical protein
MLETDRLLLPLPDVADLDGYAAIFADPEVVRFIGGETLEREDVEGPFARRTDLYSLEA